MRFGILDFRFGDARESSFSFKSHILLSFISAALLVLNPVQGKAKNQLSAVVRLRAETTVGQERLVLGDIAEVRSGDESIVKRLRAVPLGYAPNTGAVREITRERIQLAIAAAGFPDRAVQVEGQTFVLIRRAAQTVDPAVICAAVERAALSQLEADGATVRVSRIDVPPHIEVQSGLVEVRATIGGVRNLLAPFTVFIELWVDGRIARRISATAQVEVTAPVVVALRELTANKRVREEDVSVEPRRLERAASLYVRAPSQLRGKIVRHHVAAGEALTTDELVAEIVVKVGDAVRIVGESGTLQVAVAGEARASGRVGDRIQVRNTQSGSLLQAIVVDEGLVRVRF